MAIYGFVIPRLSALQLLTAERNAFSEPVIEMMRSYSSFTSEYVSRGGDHWFAILWLHMMWNLKRKVKYSQRGSIEFYRLPFGILWTPGELGGIDMIPWTLMGASKSSLMYQVYEGEIRDYINYCAHLIDVNTSIFREAIAREVFSGDTFRKGTEFLEKHLDDTRRMESHKANERLKSLNIDIGKWRYDLAAERFVKRAIADNPRLVEIVREEKKKMAGLIRSREKTDFSSGSVTRCYVPNAERISWLVSRARDFVHITMSTEEPLGWSRRLGKHFIVLSNELTMDTSMSIGEESEMTTIPSRVRKIVIPHDMWSIDQNEFEAMFDVMLPPVDSIKNRLWEKYKWMSGMYFKYGETVPPKHDVNAIVGISDDIRSKMLAIGLSSIGDDHALKVTALAQALVRDRKMPADITSDALLNVILNPAIYPNPDVVISVLQAMGVGPEAAGKFALQLHGTTSKYLMVNTIQSFSTRDMIIGHMDLSDATYHEVVRIADLGNQRLSDYISGLGMLHSLVDKEDGIRRTHIMVRGNLLADAYKEMLGVLFDENMALVRFFPDVPLS
jgi:hypothetical protein